MVKRKESDIIERKLKAVNKIKEYNNDNFKMTGDFFNSKTKTEFFCNLCNNYFYIKPEYMFKSRNSCNNKDCRYRRENTPYKDLETFKKELYEKFGNSFEYISGFKGYQEYCNLKCNNCGNEEFYIKPRNIIGKDKITIYCNVCADDKFKYNFKGKKLNNQSFKERFENKHGKNQIDILGKYVNNKTPLKVKFLKCEHETSLTPYSLMKNNRCNICSKSSGEIFAYELLTQNNIEFEMEKKFEGYNFRFDIYIKNLDLLIELDGKMHRQAYGFVTKKERNESLEEIKRRDKEKDSFCKEKNKELIRLPYDKDIYNEIYKPLCKILNL